MSFQEKKAIVNIISSILVTGVYFTLVFIGFHDRIMAPDGSVKFLAVLLLIFIGISIVTRIVLYIIFMIVNTIVTREVGNMELKDEMDKLIELKAYKNGSYVMMAGFIIVLILLATITIPGWLVIVLFVLFAFLSEIAENIAHIVYYRKGV